MLAQERAATAKAHEVAAQKELAAEMILAEKENALKRVQRKFDKWKHIAQQERDAVALLESDKENLGLHQEHVDKANVKALKKLQAKLAASENALAASENALAASAATVATLRDQSAVQVSSSFVMDIVSKLGDFTKAVRPNEDAAGITRIALSAVLDRLAAPGAQPPPPPPPPPPRNDDTLSLKQIREIGGILREFKEA